MNYKNLTPEYILQCYKENPSYFYRKIKREYPEEYAALEKEFGKSVPGLYILVYGEEARKCKYCGTNTPFMIFRDGFQKYCSHNCYIKADQPKENRKNTNIKIYGVAHTQQNEGVREKYRLSMIEREGNSTELTEEQLNNRRKRREKFENTMMERYGVKNALENKNLLNKARQNFTPELLNQIKIKRKKTNLEKYGVEHPHQSIEIQNKIKNVMIERYGVECNLILNENVNKSKKIRNLHFQDRLREKCIQKNIKPLFDISGHKSVHSIHEFLCLTCNNEFEDTLKPGRTNCPICYPVYDGASKGESELRDYIKLFALEKNTPIDVDVRTLIPPKHIDIYLPDYNLAFEYDGLYWHSERKVEKNYHLDKTLACQKKNIQLIHVFENEWIFKKEIVKSRINTFLGKNEKIYARKCKIKTIDNKQYINFMLENHVQGTCPAKIVYGLYFNDDLVTVIAFGKSRYNKKYEYELLRFADKLNISTIGGASKLFSYFIKTHNPVNIISYSDKRWNSGDLYKKLGFVFSHSSAPDYFYSIDGLKLESRIKYQKHKLEKILKIFDANLSESENMRLNGYNRIFDCGNDVFVWNK